MFYTVVYRDHHRAILIVCSPARQTWGGCVWLLSMAAPISWLQGGSHADVCKLSSQQLIIIITIIIIIRVVAVVVEPYGTFLSFCFFHHKLSSQAELHPETPGLNTPEHDKPRKYCYGGIFCC